MGETRGWLKRRIDRFTAADEDLEARELQDQVAAAGAVPVERCADRADVCVAGTIQSVTLRTHGTSPSVEVEVYDGTGTVVLVFLGRRRIPGIESGRSVVGHGRITHRDGRRVIFNPRYELLPVSGSANA